MQEQTDIHALLRQRRSGRAYDANRPISEADLNGLLEAARWAPSASNLQPWRFIIARKGDATWESLFGLLSEGNRTWAQHAPLLILTAAHAVRIDAEGRKHHNRTALHDLGMANFSISLEAIHRGMMVRMMGGYDHIAARALVDADQRDLELGPIIAVGFEGSAEQLPEDLRKRKATPRARKPVGELLLVLESMPV